MREMRVYQNDAGQRLDRFLAKAVPNLPGTLAQKYIRTKRIKVGGKRTEQSYRLCEGDVIQLYIGEEFFEATGHEKGRAANGRPYDLAPTFVVCYEDEWISIVVKLPGLLSHSGSPPGEVTLAD